MRFPCTKCGGCFSAILYSPPDIHGIAADLDQLQLLGEEGSLAAAHVTTAVFHVLHNVPVLFRFDLESRSLREMNHRELVEIDLPDVLRTDADSLHTFRIGGLRGFHAPVGVNTPDFPCELCQQRAAFRQGPVVVGQPSGQCGKPVA